MGKNIPKGWRYTDMAYELRKKRKEELKKKWPAYTRSRTEVGLLESPYYSRDFIRKQIDDEGR